ncbi:uncharacterized protein LOC133296921 [Gastrolobium bilobum]|uniref:uncharacterized protein LOC133296921 n=1 Tax=Gastrolobium bilobum TaxID=150636 RepID=UPI002AB136DF|nr:uncharacterized protein LOC133296921 [Gastrolobium bilobum]
MLGDFNSILHDHEKKGGAQVYTGSVREMSQCLEDCSIEDMGFKGPNFTWRRGRLEERLDRVVVNEAWSLDWPNSYLLVEELAYYQREEYTNESNNTEKRGIPETMLNSFRAQAKEKNWIFARLEGIECHLNLRFCSSLVRLQRELWTQLESILLREELEWFQRSCCNWIKLGDRNIRYFHANSVARRRRNQIEALKDDRGSWVTEEKELIILAKEYYQNLFHEDIPCR